MKLTAAQVEELAQAGYRAGRDAARYIHVGGNYAGGGYDMEWAELDEANRVGYRAFVWSVVQSAPVQELIFNFHQSEIATRNPQRETRNK
jgi:hypothetical protein